MLFHSEIDGGSVFRKDTSYIFKQWFIRNNNDQILSHEEVLKRTDNELVSHFQDMQILQMLVKDWLCNKRL